MKDTSLQRIALAAAAAAALTGARPAAAADLAAAQQRGMSSSGGRRLCLIVSRPARAGAGFDFYDLRVQASEDSAPALRQVRSGQEVRVGVYVRYWQPARTKRASSAARSRSGASRPGNPFAFFMATRARYVCRYTLLYKGLDLRHDTLPVDLTLAKGSAVTTFGAFRITLPEGVRENTYLVRAAVTMNGATQTRTTRFTVYREGGN